MWPAYGYKRRRQHGLAALRTMTGWLERDIFPFIGQAAISTLTPKDILLCQQRMEARGVMESPHRVKQICGQVFRFAVASDLVERDVTADLKGALSVVKTTNYRPSQTPGRSGHSCVPSTDMRDILTRSPLSSYRHYSLYGPASYGPQSGHKSTSIPPGGGYLARG